MRTIHVGGESFNVEAISLEWQLAPTGQVDEIPLDSRKNGRWEVPFFVTDTDHFGSPHEVSICTLKSNESVAVLHLVISGFVHPVS